MLAFSTVSQIGYMMLAVGTGRLHRGHLPHGLPRLLQGPALPRGRLGDPRPGRRAGPQTHGRRCASGCPGPTAPSWSAGWPSPASRRSRASGPRATCSTNVYAKSPALWAVGVLTALLHRLLHEPAVLPDLHRRGPLAAAGARRPPGPPHAPRVALGHAAPAGDPGRVRRRRRASSTCPGSTTTSFASWLAPVFAHSLFADHQSAAPPVGAGHRRRRGGRASAWPSPGVLWRDRATGRPSSRRSSSGSGTGTTSTTRSSAGPARPWPGSAPPWSTGRVIDGAVNGVAALVAAQRQRGPAAPDRLRPQLRPGHRPRAGRDHRLHGHPGVVVVSHRPASPT